MTDLQVALLALGAIIIFAVIAFNWWQERKFRKEASARFDVPQGDVLMDDEFHFDVTAILKDDAAAPARTEPEDANEILRAATETQEQATAKPLPDEYPELAQPVEPLQTSSAFEFNEIWDEIQPQVPVSDADKTTSVAKSYEEDSWRSDNDQAEAEKPVAFGSTVPDFKEPGQTRLPSAEMQATKPESKEFASGEHYLKEGIDDSLPLHDESQTKNAAENATIGQEPITQELITQEPGTQEPMARESQLVPAIPVAEPVALSADIDPGVDLIALLHFAQTVSGDNLREFLMLVADIDKPVQMHGLGMDGVWRLITSEQDLAHFTKATCAVQLADRSGYISTNAINRFQHEVDRIGLKLNANVVWQPQADPAQMANELDQFCIDVDKMVGFHLVQGSNGPFTGTKFRGLAEANGLILGADGAFHSENEYGNHLFSVVNRDNHPFSADMLRISVIHGVTFQLDIPRVKNCAEVFNQMVLTARQMENSVNGSLVDDNQRPIGEMQIEKIRQQLKAIQAKMVARGIVPGGPTALRLFS
jgi:FtsZ-interacting cell division protein ZipA